MKFRFQNPLTNLYNQNNIQDPALRKDLNLFIVAVTIGTVFFAISGGTPFTGFAQALGLNDFMYSVLIAVPVALSLLQFINSWVLDRMRNRRKLFIVAGLIQRSLWLPVALVPLFIPADHPSLRMWMVVGLISLSSAAGSFMNVTFYSWLGDILPQKIRGHYMGLRSSVATVLGLVSALAASFILDRNPTLTGYMWVFGVGSLFGIGDIVTFFWVREPLMVVEPHNESHWKLILQTFRNRGFLGYLVFWTAWIFCWNLSGPFFNMYALGKLNLSMTVTTLVGQVASSIMTAYFIQWWGRHLDNRGVRWVLVRCGIAASITPLFWLFASPGNFWPYLLFALGNGIFVCGVDVTAAQMLMTATPTRNRSVFLATYLVVTQVVGASLGNLAGGKLLDVMGELQFRFAGFDFDRYKLLFIGVGLLRFLIILFLLPLLTNVQGGTDEPINLKE